MPKVSVLTPIYNTNPEHLREMIESVLNQSFQDFEFLILNDSPENTELDDIIKSYDDKRIVYIKNDKNMGISGSRNKLLHLAKGEYLAILDHDDICMPDRLKREVEFLDLHPGVGVVSGWMRIFGAKNRLLKNPEKNYEIKLALMDNCAIYHTAAMMRASVLRDNDIEYENYYSPAEDHRLWIRLMDVTNFYNIPEILVKYRWHNDNTSISQLSKMNEKIMELCLDARSKHMGYYESYRRTMAKGPIFKMRLFGIIPIFIVKHNWVRLFGFIPLFKIKWS